MKNKKLTTLFLDYLTTLSQEDTNSQAGEEDQMWLLFSEEDFHINRKNNTLYVKPVDVLIENIFKDDSIETAQIEWVGYQSNPLTLQHKITVGVDNPFTNYSLSSFVNNQSIIKAIPYRYAVKMHKKNTV